MERPLFRHLSCREKRGGSQLLPSLSTNIISNLTNNVKFFFVFSFFSFVLLKEFPLWTSGLIPISFLIFHNDSLFLVSHLSYTYSIPQVKGQCQVFFDINSRATRRVTESSKRPVQLFLSYPMMFPSCNTRRSSNFSFPTHRNFFSWIFLSINFLTLHFL